MNCLIPSKLTLFLFCTASRDCERHRCSMPDLYPCCKKRVTCRSRSDFVLTILQKTTLSRQQIHSMRSKIHSSRSSTNARHPLSRKNTKRFGSILNYSQQEYLSQY